MSPQRACALQTNPRRSVQSRGDAPQEGDLEEKNMIQDYGPYYYRYRLPAIARRPMSKRGF